MSRKLIFLVLLAVLAGQAGPAGAQSLVQIDPATVTDGNVYLMDNVVANVPDDSANNNNGNLIGSPTPVAGLNGGALQFNGTSDGVHLPDATTINTSTHQNKTVIAVFNCADVSKTTQVVYEEGGSTRGLNIYVEQGSAYVGAWNRGDYTPDFPGTWLSAPIGSNEWHVVAAVLRGATGGQADDKFEMWLDGKLVAKGPGGELRSRSDDNGIANVQAQTRIHNALVLDAGYWFGGIIDELWILNQALSEAELSALRIKKSLTAFGPSPANGDVYDNDWVSLTWKPGGFAVSHDVYLGTSFEDVNDGAASTFQGNVAVPFFAVGTPGVSNAPANLVPGQTYYWRIDEVNDVNDASPWKGEVWSFRVRPAKAWSPVPANGTTFVDVEEDLNWDVGLGTVFHTVFFGTSLEEVTNATAGNMTADPTYDPGTLQPDTTYYWRVDEFTFPANVTNKGDVWSFTTLPDFPVTDPNLMVWWRLDENTGTRAIDWSGHGRHGDFQSQPLWVEGYDGAALNFDDIDDSVILRFADETWSAYTVAVWAKADVLGQANNSSICATYGTATTNGFQLSFDAADNYQYHAGVDQIIGPASLGWVHLAVTYDGTVATAYYNGVPVATFAPPTQDLTHNKFAIGVNRAEDNWFDGTIDDFRVYDRALTQEEIELVLRVDPLQAWQPNPADGVEADIRTATPLTWTKGDNAAKHDVYFGTDATAVAAADSSDTTGVYRSRVSTTSFTPAEDLDWGQTYFWRVDESNTDGSITTGKVWSFTVPDYLIVDNFESYNDLEGSRIYETWIDGWTNGTGSVVGNLVAPFAETTVVYSGKQAMPFDYNNVNTPWYSEAEREFSPVENWTFGGADTLVLDFQGAPVDFLESAGTITLSAAGTDIWNTVDEFRYVFKRLTGDGSIVARVDSITNSNVWAKGGVMIRESLDPSSRHAMVAVTPGSGVAFQRRLVNNDVSVGTTEAGITAPHWVKLTRTGNVLTAQHSADGVTWGDVVNATNPTSDTVVMGGTIYIGLALTSHAASVACTAVFSEIQTTGNVTGSWQQVDIGVDHPGNSAQGLYVGIEDSAGKVAFVTYADPAATTLATWTEWAIPLTSFTGVNPAKVKKMYLGVGDRENPVPDGAGRIYIDDIRVTKGMPQPTP